MHKYRGCAQCKESGLLCLGLRHTYCFEVIKGFIHTCMHKPNDAYSDWQLDLPFSTKSRWGSIKDHAFNQMNKDVPSASKVTQAPWWSLWRFKMAIVCNVEHLNAVRLICKQVKYATNQPTFKNSTMNLVLLWSK